MRLSQSHYIAGSAYAITMSKVARCTVENDYVTAFGVVQGIIVNETDGQDSEVNTLQIRGCILLDGLYNNDTLDKGNR